MATYTDTLGFNKGSAAYPAYGDTRIAYMETVLDFAAIIAARAAAGATALAAETGPLAPFIGIGAGVATGTAQYAAQDLLRTAQEQEAAIQAGLHQVQ